MEIARLLCVTVTYQPVWPVLLSQLRALPEDSLKIVVDNASGEACQAALLGLTEQFARLHVVLNARNVGLGAAINQGVRVGQDRTSGVEFVLLLDQDSEPCAGSVETLLQAFQSMEKVQPTGAVGPLLRDAETGLFHGFHQCTRWRWRRIYPALEAREPVACASLNGSGTLMRAGVFRELGGLNEDFFIDHLDTEWSFRLLAKGLGLWGIPQAVFRHRMGQRSIRYWFFGWRLWPSRSPDRHYMLVRNTVRLIRGRDVPLVWKFWACAKMLLTFFAHVLLDPKRLEQMKKMLSGCRDGFSQEKV
jgi:rhamnosyltransferase